MVRDRCGGLAHGLHHQRSDAHRGLCGDLDFPGADRVLGAAVCGCQAQQSPGDGDGRDGRWMGDGGYTWLHHVSNKVGGVLKRGYPQIIHFPYSLGYLWEPPNEEYG